MSWRGLRGGAEDTHSLCSLEEDCCLAEAAAPAVVHLGSVCPCVRRGRWAPDKSIVN